LLGFRSAYVFDVSQTNGVNLAALNEVTGDPNENIDRLEAFVKSKGIQLVYNASIAPCTRHELRQTHRHSARTVEGETLATLVIETAHELLHRSERRTATTKIVHETEAEAVAFVIGKAAGLVNDNASASYIQLYHGNASLLEASLEVIQQTASVILAALEPSL
jgi:hypothetical protein